MTPEIMGLRFAVALSVFLLSLDLGHGESSYWDATIEKPALGNVIDARTKNVTPMHKALLTQRGYIQFLRWELPVPEIEEFTFCVWVKSTNLTYPHSIFSYSKNEKERLVRAWISSHGRSVHLEIGSVEIFSYPSYIREHRWYHICESWDNAYGRYALWIDGEKKIDGYATKMTGHVIPSNGDIVLGQEYTDFDKGLEEGIEGAVLGFNLVLSSAFDSKRPLFVERNKLDDTRPQIETDVFSRKVGLSGTIYGKRSYTRDTTEQSIFPGVPLIGLENFEIGSADRRDTNIGSRSLEARRVLADGQSRRKFRASGYWENDNSAGTTLSGEKPLGQRLVEMSYVHCQQGRGSPKIGGKLMLISWTRTPMKVFGGAIIKNSKSDCGNF